MNYIENPNFPKGKSTVVAVSSEAKDVIDALQSAKICVVPVDPCSSLPEGIASHADLQLLHLGSNSMLTASCSNKCEEMLKSIGFDLKAAPCLLADVTNRVLFSVYVQRRYAATFVHNDI